MFEVGTSWEPPTSYGPGFFPFNSQTPALNKDFVLSGTTVPEPGNLVALASGLCGLMGFAIRRRR